jgi:serine/threonine protein phosphatase PrpC
MKEDSTNQEIINNENLNETIKNDEQSLLAKQQNLASLFNVVNPSSQTSAVITLANMQAMLEQAKDEQQAEEPKNMPLATQDEPADKISNIQIGNIHISQGGLTGRYAYKEPNAQEDRADVTVLTNYTLTPEQTGQALYATVIELGNEYKNKNAGSTLVTAVAYNNQIITANVGDSRAMLVMKGADGKFTCTRLSVEHKASKASEQERVVIAGGFIGGLLGIRLNNNLAITRSIGDHQPSNPGLIYEPEISYSQVPTEALEAYLVLCSDGISDVMNEAEIAEIYNQHFTTSTNMADTIRHQAYKRDINGDNLTVVITPIPKDNQSVVAMVADGHGGAEVSELLKQNFATSFKKKAQATARVNSLPELIPVPLKIENINQEVEMLDLDKLSKPHGYKIQNQSNSRFNALAIAGNLLGLGIGIGLIVGSTLLLAGIISLSAALAPYMLFIAIPALIIGVGICLPIGIASMISLSHEYNKEEEEIPLTRKARQQKSIPDTDEAVALLDGHKPAFNLLDDLRGQPSQSDQLKQVQRSPDNTSNHP